MREKSREVDTSAIDIAKYSTAFSVFKAANPMHAKPIIKVTICIIASIVCFITIPPSMHL